MPVLPRPARLSLHDAVGYVAKSCKCDLIEAGKAVFYALGEGMLIAHANVLNRYRTPGSMGYLDDGVQPAPAVLWARYPWRAFERRALEPRGNPQYREHTAEGRQIGPVFADPRIATADIDRWFGAESASVAPVEAPARSAKTLLRGRRGRKPGSGSIDDEDRLRRMLQLLATGEARS
jgi:hypothetical protein